MIDSQTKSQLDFAWFAVLVVILLILFTIAGTFE